MTKKENLPTVHAAALTCCTLIACALTAFSCAHNPADGDGPAVTDPPPGANTVTLEYAGPDFSSWKALYAAWIEDEQGNNLQNLYVCTHVRAQNLTGTVLPYWETVKRTQKNDDIDEVTGASLQGANTVTRRLNLGGIQRFRVCFEIDRSRNDNDYFIDRPSFTYKSALINLSGLEGPYGLALHGWMSNDTTGTFSQAPTTPIAGWNSYTSYIAETGTADSWSDMVTSLSVFFEAE